MSIPWILFVACVVLFVQMRIYRRYGLRKLQYSRHFNVAACYEGDEVEMIERIANRKLLPLPWLRLESMIHAGLRFRGQFNLDIKSGQFFQNHTSVFHLQPYMQITRTHRVVCAKRGHYFLQSATLTCGDPIGLQRSYKQLPLSCELLVYPRVVPLADIPLPSHSWLGDLVVRRWVVDDPFLLAGVREYRSGDALNRVNWSATARTGSLQVHKRDYTADHRLMIYVNFDVTEQMWKDVSDPELIELGLSYAATLATYAIRQGVETGFGCNGYTADAKNETVRVPAGSGQDHLQTLLETMARLEMARYVGIDAFLERDVAEGVTQQDIVLITSFVSDAMQTHIDSLRRAGNAVDIVPLTRALLTGSVDAGQAAAVLAAEERGSYETR